MNPPPMPTPADLDHAPELAVLAVLASALIAARISLIAAHAALRSGDDELQHAQPASAWMAGALIPLLNTMGEHIECYRQVLRCEQRQGRGGQTAGIPRF